MPQFFITVTRPPYSGYPKCQIELRGDHVLQITPDNKGRGTWLTQYQLGQILVSETPEQIKALCAAGLKEITDG